MYELREQFSKHSFGFYNTFDEAVDRMENSKLTFEIRNTETGEIHTDLDVLFKVSRRG